MIDLHLDRITISSARPRHGLVDITGIPTRLINYLNDNQVQYEILHQPGICLEPEAKKAKNRIARFHAKVAMVKAGHQHVVTVLPHSHYVDLKRLSIFVGESVRLDMEEEFKWLFPDCVADAIPPFGTSTAYRRSATVTWARTITSFSALVRPVTISNSVIRHTRR